MLRVWAIISVGKPLSASLCEVVILDQTHKNTLLEKKKERDALSDTRSNQLEEELLLQCH